MKHWTDKLFCTMAMLGIIFACSSTTANALVDPPSVELRDLVSIADTPGYVYNKNDNYGNQYASAIGSGFAGQNFEYLLDGKYSSFVGTLFVEEGVRGESSTGVIVTADGQEIYSSPALRKDSKPIDINVDIRGHNRVSVRFVHDGGDCYLGFARAGFNLLKPSEVDPVNPGGQNIYRMYNGYSGEHLFTTDGNEADSLMSGGWKWEDTSSVPATGDPVYRLCNPYTGEHLYTTDFNEYKQLSTSGWQGEGQKFYSAGADGKPFYRLYNRWGSGGTAHHYTTDQHEVSTLTGQGWRNDGPCWYGVW